MRFNLRLTVVSVVILLVMASCAGTISPVWTPPEECNNATSLILQHVPDPQSASLVLQLVNLEAIKNGLYSKDDASEVIKSIEDYLEFGITWSDFVAYTVSKIGQDYAAEIFLLSGYMDIFACEASIINECDKALLLAHLAKQKRIIALLR